MGNNFALQTQETVKPEPFASMVDILTAAQYVEKAIHSANVTEVQTNMHSALQYLGYASAYLHTAGLYNEELAVNNVIQCYNNLMTHISTMALATFQTQVLYNSMANLHALYVMVQHLALIGAGKPVQNVCLNSSTTSTTHNASY